MSDPIRVLLADDDPDIRMYLEVTLRLAGFDVTSAVDGAEAVARVRRERFHVVLLDVMMPDMDGLEATRTLRADPSTSDVPIILVTAKAIATDRVAGLDDGADDYITKPFDPDELVARVHAAVRRSDAMRQVSPLSGLPGNPRIEAELARRLEVDEPFSLLYCDLNRFKAYNDHYSWLDGDSVLRGFADLLRRVVADIAPGITFVGHVGGDDYVVITGHDEPEELAAAICEAFDETAPTFYDERAQQVGHIEVGDRQGLVTKVPLVSVSIGVAVSVPGYFTHPGEVAARATEMKRVAKSSTTPGSSWALDRRAPDNR